MSDPAPKPTDEIRIDAKNLFREDTFTDLRVGSIRHLVPVKPDGSPDGARQPRFVGQTHMMTQAGPVPLQFAIEAKSLDEAMRKFPEAVQRAVDAMVEEVRELQRQEASRIVVPKARPGKIQLG